MNEDREIIIDGDVARIPLTRGCVAIIDAEDVPLIGRRKWCASSFAGKTIYAVRNEISNGKKRMLYLHRIILGLDDPHIIVDHADMNGLNNRRSNLRQCTKAQNLCNRGAQINNTSGFKGVSRTESGRWAAYIGIPGGHKYLGRFDTPESAHAAYAAAAIDLYGEFARS